jgi:tetratricopeptide (TPR) repeat protein
MLLVGFLLLVGSGWAADYEFVDWEDWEDLGDFNTNYQKVSLQDVLDRPQAYRDVPITFSVRFHQQEEIGMPFFSPFSREAYLSFSVWDGGQRLWKEEEYTADFPFCFIRRGGDRVVRTLAAMKSYQPLRVSGVVSNVYEGKPWIEIFAVRRVREPVLTDAILHALHAAETALAQGSPEIAVESYRRVLEEPLPDDVAGEVWFGLGRAHLGTGAFPEAVDALNKATGFKHETASVWREYGRALRLSGNLSGAVDALNEAIRLQGKDEEGRLLLAYCFEAMGDDRQARLEAAKAVAVNPAYAEARHQLARLAWRAGALGESVEHYQEAIRLDPKAFPAYRELGLVFDELDRLQDAQRVWEKAKGLRPDDAEVYFLLGDLYIRLEQYPRAEPNLKEALRLKPAYLEPAVSLAWLLHEQGHLPEAKGAYDRVLELDPKMVSAYLVLGRITEATGEHEACEAAYRKAAELDGRSGEAFSGLGGALYRLDRLPESAKAFENGVRLAPDDAAALFMLGRVYLELEDPRAAARHLEVLVGLTPGDVAVRANLGMAYVMSGQLAKGREQFEKGMELSTDDPYLLNNYAYGLLKSGDELGRALALATQAASGKQGGNPAFLHTLGWAHLVNGQVPQAVDILGKACAADADLLEAQYHYGSALHRAGDSKRAGEVLQKLCDQGGDWAREAKRLLSEMERSPATGS